VILLHGGQGDYRSWEPQMAALSRYYRVVSYSRRYNFPNHNPQTATNHSVLVEAADLAALIKALHLKRVNLIGTSMGAATALMLAVEHPNMVRSLVLAEPHPGLGKTFSGRGSIRGFHARSMTRRAMLAAGNDEVAMRFVDGFATPGRLTSWHPKLDSASCKTRDSSG
jgi:pimeloyl-ACP methyl ester carboxylesterase